MEGNLYPVLAPVNPALFPQLAMLFFALGGASTAYFLVYEFSTSTAKDAPAGQKRSLAKELVVAAICSLFLGLGSFFLMLYGGVYV